MTSRVDVVRVENISKNFTIRRDNSLKDRLLNFRQSQAQKETFWALRDVSFTIQSGTTVGLLGANGSGKSTLLKLIGGILKPSHGTISRRGRFASLLELGAGFNPDMTGLENIYLNAAILGLDKREISEIVDSVVDFSELGDFIHTQVKFYSSGMYVRLGFSIAIHVNPDVLLVDEVLAVGDEPFQDKCTSQIRKFQEEGRTIILVSHSASQVESLCDRTVVLSHGQLVFDGPTKEGIASLRASF